MQNKKNTKQNNSGLGGVSWPIKRKKSNNLNLKMKKLLLATVILLSTGCNNNPANQKPPSGIKVTKESRISYYDDVMIIEYDSCEYVRFEGGKEGWGGHKGNCKYCLRRSQIKDSLEKQLF